MFFKEWIETQDQDLWGLDLASITAITNHFSFREICDFDKMPIFFWRDINAYRERYKAMLRVEASDATIDPFVNKYFEGQYTAERSATNKNITTKTDNQATTEGRRNSYLNPEILDIKETSKVDDTRTVETGFNNRAHDKTVHGSKSNRQLADSRNNFTKDSAGSSETVTAKNTSTASGTNITSFDERNNDITSSRSSEKTEGVNNTINRHATKAAPMSASGVTTGLKLGPVDFDALAGGYGPSASARIGTGGLGRLDFEYASEYGENDTENGVLNHSSRDGGETQTRSKTGSNTEQTSNGTTDNTSETRNYNRGTQVGIDITETETYNNYGETVKETGTEKVTNGGSVNTTDTQHRTLTKSNETISGESTKKNDSKEEQTGNNTNNELTRNIYTGRDGLTPQEGLKSAIEYLQQTPQALQWLLSKLEHNFIQIWEI